ncbi:Sec-independent protein translocase subunit TatA [Corynebacterium frankenforstense]|uniref:Sec-independent protein translocase subunit TatA n=1 Tax=Corynebacterium frankenforstense TaxID=1230998 RepID=UPI0009FB31E6|nr:Sec-independent protein translocase subunit TatA [Corynebacterium frankenforstense]
MPNLGWPEILIILLVIVILFGAKKLPDAARSVGRSMRIFKSEMKEMGNDEDLDAKDAKATKPAQGEITSGSGRADVDANDYAPGAAERRAQGEERA